MESCGLQYSEEASGQMRENKVQRWRDSWWASSLQFPCPGDLPLCFPWVLRRTSVLENFTLSLEIFWIGISLLLNIPSTTRYLAIPSFSYVLCQVAITFKAVLWHVWHMWVMSWQQAHWDVRTEIQINHYIPCESNTRALGPHHILLVASWLVMILVLRGFSGNQRASVKCLFKILPQHAEAACEGSLYYITGMGG